MTAVTTTVKKYIDTGDDGAVYIRGSLLQESSDKGIGYGTGSGGAVTQATSITTSVELNKINGQITTVASTLAAAAEATFVVTNSTVAATDHVGVSTTYAGGGTIMLGVSQLADGSFAITIANLHASAALDAVVVINFAVTKVVAA